MIMEKTAGKLFAARKRNAPIANDYAALLKTVFCPWREYNSELNHNAELIEATASALSVLSDIERYCVEEVCLHGKSLEQLADEFRSVLNMERFAEEFIEGLSYPLLDAFKEKTEEAFLEMRKNSFRELKGELRPRSIIDILLDAVKELNDWAGIWAKDVFERYYLRGETKEELGQWFSENMEDYVRDNYFRALRKLRVSAKSRAMKKFMMD